MTDNLPAEPEYIVVCENESEGSNCLELPINTEDNTLGLQTLKHAFPNAHGLKFRNPATGTYRALLIDSGGTCFYKPVTGWEDKLYIVITQQSVDTQSTQQFVKKDIQSSSNTKQKVQKFFEKGTKFGENGTTAKKKILTKSDQNAKRRKPMIESDEEDDDSTDSEFNGNKSFSNDKRLRQSSHGGAASKQKRLSNAVDNKSENIKEKTDKSNKSSDDDLPECTDLIVLGLPFKITEVEIREYFEQYGGVSFIDIKKKLSGSSKGFGFIRMETFEGQLKVLNKSIHLIGNRKCQVRVPLDKNGEIREDPLIGAKVFIGRLQEKTSVSDLKKYFNTEAKNLDENASVLDVYIPKPFRAFAFVTFSSPLIAKKLIKKGGFLIDGALLSIQSAQPKTLIQNSIAGSTSPGFVRRGTSSSHYHDDEAYYNWYDTTHGSFRGEIWNNYSFLHSRIPPPNGYGSNNIGNSSSTANTGIGGHQIIANGLETLNLNNMKPEIVTALKALMSAHKNVRGGVEDSSSPPPLLSARGVSPTSQRLFGPTNSNMGGGYLPPQMNHFSMSSRRNGGGGNNNGNGINSGWR